MTRDRSSIEERLRKILITELEVDPATVAASTPRTPLLGRGIGLDSIESLALVAAIEEEFGIRVEDADLTVELFASLQSLVDYILPRTSLPAEDGKGPRT